IGGEHGWYYIGRIPRCEVITEEQARRAKAKFDRRGWTDDMKAHVRAIGGSLRELRGPARYVFNVRFRPSAAQLYDPLVPVGKHDMVRKFRRYTLTLMRGKAARVEEQWPYRRGTTALHRTGKQRRRGTDGVVANLAERQLQNELFRLLKNEFGANSTIMEEGFADLSLTLDKVVHL